MSSTELSPDPVPSERRPSGHLRASPASPIALLREAAEIALEAGTRWSDDGCASMGASLAYYALFSIFPLLLVAVTVLGFFLGEDPMTRARVLGAVSGVVSPELESLLDQTLASMQSHETARGVGAVVGLVTLVFGASGVFSELNTSLNKIWRVKAAPVSGFGKTVLRALEDKAIAFASVVVAGAVLLTSLLVRTGLEAFTRVVGKSAPATFLWTSVEFWLSLVLSTVVFAIVFRMLPRAYVAWRDVLGGAFFTALFFNILKHLLAWYLGNIGSYAAYGAVGAVLGLLTWIYLVSLLVFFGAELTRVYAEREGSVAHRAAGYARAPVAMAAKT